MNNIIKTSSKGARQGGIGLKNILNEGIFNNVIYYTEFADGRKYVGQTTQGFLERHRQHMYQKRHYDNVLRTHINECVIYPICFGVEDIEDINTIDLLNGLEVAEIMLRETFNDVDPENGLNHTTGGGNHEVSEATKQKHRDYWASEEGQKRKEENSNFMKEYWASEEGEKQKEKQGQWVNDYWSEEKREEKRNELFERYGYNITIEDIKKMIDKGLTNREIAECIGCHSGSLNDLLKTRGLPSMKQLRNNGKTHWVETGEYFIKESKNGFSIFGGNNKNSSIINKIKDESKAIELCNALNNGELFPREIIRMKHKGEI